MQGSDTAVLKAFVFNNPVEVKHAQGRFDVSRNAHAPLDMFLIHLMFSFLED